MPWSVSTLTISTSSISRAPPVEIFNGCARGRCSGMVSTAAIFNAGPAIRVMWQTWAQNHFVAARRRYGASRSPPQTIGTSGGAGVGKTGSRRPCVLQSRRLAHVAGQSKPRLDKGVQDLGLATGHVPRPPAYPCECAHRRQRRRRANQPAHRARLASGYAAHLRTLLQEHRRGRGYGDRGGDKRDALGGVIIGLRWHSGGNSGFVRRDSCAKCLTCLDGDVAEWLKAAVC